VLISAPRGREREEKVPVATEQIRLNVHWLYRASTAGTPPASRALIRA